MSNLDLAVKKKKQKMIILINGVFQKKVSVTQCNKGITVFLKVKLATHLPRSGVAVPSQLVRVTPILALAWDVCRDFLDTVWEYISFSTRVHFERLSRTIDIEICAQTARILLSVYRVNGEVGEIGLELSGVPFWACERRISPGDNDLRLLNSPEPIFSQ